MTLTRPRTFRDLSNPDHSAFYVSALDGPKSFLVAGPYPDHATAIARVDAVRRHAEVDPRSHWMAWGTCSLPAAPANHTTPLGQF